jgi:hypothetical protein
LDLNLAGGFLDIEKGFINHFSQVTWRNLQENEKLGRRFRIAKGFINHDGILELNLKEPKKWAVQYSFGFVNDQQIFRRRDKV